MLNDEGRIIKFIEKPEHGSAVSHLANTGIYVLEPKILRYIPENSSCDFGKDIFDRVISAGESLYGLVLKANLIAVDTPELLAKAMGKKQKI
jgi:mannose-1-phosphate guanylyltransferase/phosphomannomutase